MPETAPHHQSEQFVRQSSDLHELVDMLTSEEVLAIKGRSINEAIAGDEAVATLDHLETEKLAATRQFYQASGDEANALNDHIQSLSEAMSGVEQPAHTRYTDLAERRWRLEHTAVLLRPEEVEADALLSQIDRAPVFQAVDHNEAPFRDYLKNGKKTAEGHSKWQVVDNAQVKLYLNKRVFYDTSRLDDRPDQPRVVIKADRDQPLEIPLDIVVSAAGFDSWLGRQGPHSGKEVSGPYARHYDRKAASLDVIKHYAALPSELPPVSELNVYVQPNGVVFADNGEGDSHRLAAAILRGQPTIKTDTVTIRNIDENIFEPLAERDLTATEKEVDWPAVKEVVESLNLHTDPATRATDIARMSATDLVAMVTLLHQSLAPNADPNPTEKRMTMVSPDEIVQYELMDPEERYAYFELAADLINKLGYNIPAGGEEDFLKRASNIIALTTVIAHPFEDGNGRTARTAALLFRYGPPETDEAMNDLQLIGSNRVTGEDGVRLLGFVPRYAQDMSKQEFLEAVAALDIPVKGRQTYADYQQRATRLFTNTFND